ncbi:DUF1330 domain-containing protein [soil metagenome]
MAKGYWIIRADVTDPAKYERYRAANAESLRQFGARFLVRGGTFEKPEGGSKPRNVVIEFPSYQAAVDCYRSTEYQRAKAERAGAASMDFIIIEGYDGAQP